MKNEQMRRNIFLILLWFHMLICALQIFGRFNDEIENMLISAHGVIMAGCMVFMGFWTYVWQKEGVLRKNMLSMAQGLFIIYMVASFGRFFIMDEKALFENIIKSAVFLKIVKYAELYFEWLVVAICCGFLGHWLEKAERKIRWLILIGLALTGIFFMPDLGILYPVFGVFIGASSFKSMPLLANMIFYFAGYILAKNKIHECLKLEKLNMYFERWIGWSSEQGIYLEMCVYILVMNVIRKQTNYYDISIKKILFIFVLSWLIVHLCCKLLMFLYDHQVWKRVRSKYVGYFVLYTIGFVIMALLVYWPFMENGYALIWKRDAISQYFPRAIYYARYMRELFSNFLAGDFHIKMYDFTLGMGDSVPIKLEPLYWLHMLFSPDDMERGYQFVLLLRIYLSGLSLSALFAYFKKNWKITWVCSYIYCFSGYLLYECTRHAHFIVPFITLPILVIAVEEILRKKKWYLGSIMIALSLLTSYYFLFMNTIALVIYFLVRFFNMPEKERNWKQFWSYIGVFALAYILGVGMGCMTIFTSIFNYLGSARSGAGVMTEQSLFSYRLTWIHDLYMYFIGYGEGLSSWTKLNFVPFSYIAMILLFLRKRKKELKICLSFGLIGLCFPFVAYVMSGLGNVTNRWLYILCLIVTCVIAEGLEAVGTLTKNELKSILWGMMPYFLMLLFYGRYQNTNVAMAMCVMLVSYIVMAFASKEINIFSVRQSRILLSVLMMISLIVSGNRLFGADGAFLVEEYAKKGQAIATATDTDIAACTAIDDDEFYRVTERDTLNTNLCASSALDVNSISYFNSTMNGKLLEFNAVMGNVKASLIDQVSYNNRTMLNALACVKYYAALDDAYQESLLPYGYTLDKKVTYNDKNYVIYKTDATLPLTYSYEKTMSRTMFEEYSPEERQELMMSHAIIEDQAELLQSYDTTPTPLTGHRLEVKDILLENATWEDQVLSFESGSKVTFTFDPVQNAEVYFVLNGRSVSEEEGEEHVRVTVESQQGRYIFQLKQPDNIYYLDMDAFVMNAGYSEGEISQISLGFTGKGKIIIDDWSLYCQSMGNYEDQIKALKQDQLENLVMEDNYISGTIETSKPKLLTLSIPYQNGWTAYVDGEKVKLQNVNVMYMGIEIAPGKHDVELRFEWPGVKMGMMLTGISIILFIIAVLVDQKIRRRYIG